MEMDIRGLDRAPGVVAAREFLEPAACVARRKVRAASGLRRGRWSGNPSSKQSKNQGEHSCQQD